MFGDAALIYKRISNTSENVTCSPGLSAVRPTLKMIDRQQMDSMLVKCWGRNAAQTTVQACHTYKHVSMLFPQSDRAVSGHYYLLQTLLTFLSVSPILCSLTRTRVTSPHFQVPSSSMSLSIKCLIL